MVYNPTATFHKKTLTRMKTGLGSNGDILFIQTRALRDQLSSSFRFVYSNGPFFSDPGPGVLPVYKDAGPFRSWLRRPLQNRAQEPRLHMEAIRKCLEGTMKEDEQSGASGQWVGLMGFSQGARLAASVLFESQRRQNIQEKGGIVRGYEGDNIETKLWDQRWQFAVLFSGPAPLIAFCPENDHLSSQSTAEHDPMYRALDNVNCSGELHITKPTLHVIGVKDEWAPSQRELYEKYCSKESSTLVEWEGAHRIPIESSIVKDLCARILVMSKQADFVES
ncbi:hypothetical protein COCC4DRAFT_155492 [Bipolaris maydis ATCC 48331]|uniref:Probable esterase TOX9 n=1 Tax=Cochliobolus heterostrophus (strain C4 / ATCC 48331 / race T) TaxID=665024 RepID=TOX9_COCH4|nr:uncharacterized protein COCC4DRAFT_155492 [Bipolaris maydis ATCC 48331]N4WQZ8.1 RecName: Full=Probable esterase TOX9; AltName: Full=T-toxin biosynthesis protein TOX9 [Bipolaris maydis ATCC 48331]ADB23431.1 hypothetical protein [Bipolaris maydis]ENH98547.1 hypothetical protein COCC4DRAFT_155492 [Bipolaris maydis ATCC 48331]KAJ5028833.1 serine hydrolase FSH [Bipolaris maydis]KAJ5063624.1 serine hydrolase FSH [Bipolaris maydis]KAJ6199883.1 serine hydrolase FSH [Bipolaris maydis]